MGSTRGRNALPSIPALPHVDKLTRCLYRPIDLYSNRITRYMLASKIKKPDWAFSKLISVLVSQRLRVRTCVW